MWGALWSESRFHSHPYFWVWWITHHTLILSLKISPMSHVSFSHVNVYDSLRLGPVYNTDKIVAERSGHSPDSPLSLQILLQYVKGIQECGRCHNQGDFLILWHQISLFHLCVWYRCLEERSSQIRKDLICVPICVFVCRLQTVLLVILFGWLELRNSRPKIKIVNI